MIQKLSLPVLWVSGAALSIAVITALSLRAADVLAQLLGDLAAAALRLVLL